MIIEEINNVDYIEYNLKNSRMTINYKDRPKITVRKTLSEFLAFDRLLKSRGKYDS